MKAIKHIAYSGWKVNGRLEKFEKENLQFENAMALEMLEEFKGCRVEWERDENRNYVNRTVKHLVLLDAWIGYIMTTTSTEIGRGGQRHMLF